MNLNEAEILNDYFLLKTIFTIYIREKVQVNKI